MKILIDMNLSPGWTQVLTAENIEAVHWSSVGKPNAPDEEIMQYARENGYAFSRTIWTSARCWL